MHSPFHTRWLWRSLVLIGALIGLIPILITGCSAISSEQLETLQARFGVSTTRDAAAAEELLQETFLEAWRSLPRLRDAGAFSGWLRQLARHRARYWCRRAGVRRRVVSVPDPGAQPDAERNAGHCGRARAGRLEGTTT